MFESLTKNIFTIYSFEKKPYFERAARKIASEASTHASEVSKPPEASFSNRRR